MHPCRSRRPSEISPSDAERLDKGNECAPRPAKWGWPDSSKTILKSIYLKVKRGEGLHPTILRPNFWLIAVVKTPRLRFVVVFRTPALRHSEWRSSLI